MFDSPSLITRIAVGKAVGLVIGLFGFLVLWLYWPNSDPMLRLGVLFWYVTVGAIIGCFGVVTYHPILHLPMPWWVRAPAIGGWMNFVLTLFAHERFRLLLPVWIDPDSLWASPAWIVVEGAVVGLIIGFAATLLGGEGPKTAQVLRDPGAAR
jgi:hypothetical protein